MSADNFTFYQHLVDAGSAGSAITAAARTLALPPPAVFPIPAGFFNRVGKKLRIEAGGIISCVVTTPGTARFDVDAGGTKIFDGLAVPLNIVAKTSVAWRLRIDLTCYAIGTNGNLMGHGEFASEAVIGSPLPSVGGSGVINLPYNSSPAVGSNFDTTLAQVIGLYFTQTVATGSMTLQQYSLISPN